MVLVDTSVWIRFLAGRDPYASALDQLLDRGEVMAHDLVEGELLIGDRGGRSPMLASYRMLTRVDAVPHAEVLEFVRVRRLHGRGIGWMDAGLLASAIVSGAALWTADASLAAIAAELRIAHAS